MTIRMEPSGMVSNVLAIVRLGNFRLGAIPVNGGWSSVLSMSLGVALDAVSSPL